MVSIVEVGPRGRLNKEGPGRAEECIKNIQNKEKGEALEQITRRVCERNNTLEIRILSNLEGALYTVSIWPKFIPSLRRIYDGICIYCWLAGWRVSSTLPSLSLKCYRCPDIDDDLW
ncbi:hypothetical protein Bca4012_083627 [Brassica carinata]